MKKGIIVASFGTTYKETRKRCIESIENRVEDKYSDSLVLRAFTSRKVIARLKDRDNYHVDTPTEALIKMKDRDIKDIAILPLLIIKGHEYEKILNEVGEFLKSNRDFNIRIAKPLLNGDLDYSELINSLSIENHNIARVYMGHGSDHESDLSYERLEKSFREEGYKNIFIATVEGSKTIGHVITKLKEEGIDRVELEPFMLVAGDHALNDMASDEPDSWKSILEAEGIEVDLKIRGLGEIEGIQDIFINSLNNL